MANILTVTGGATALIPTTAWTAPNALFPTTARNDGSVYGWSSSTSTVTLPSTAEGDGYFITWGYQLDNTASYRSMCSGRVIQSSGTGTFASAISGGYTRNATFNKLWACGWAFVDNPSASAQLQFQFTRDTDTPTGGTSRSFLQVVPLSYADVGVYTSASTTIPGGTTPTQLTGFSGTDGTNITLTSDTVTLSSANKRYLALGSVNADMTFTARTQRWCGFREDGTKDDSTKSCMYLRSTGAGKSGTSFGGLYQTSAASKTLDLFCYLGDGTTAGLGGASSDGTTTNTNAAHAMVILELNDSAEVFRSTDSTADQEFTTSNLDVTISATADIAFNDSASFTRSTDTAVNIVQDMDVLLFANVGQARELDIPGNRWDGDGSFTISGTTQTDVGFHGNYNRGSTTFGSSYNSIGAYAVTSTDTVGYRHVRQGTTAEDVTTQPNWVGFSAINLDTLAATGGGTVTATMTGTGSTVLATQVSRANSFSHSGIGTASLTSQTDRARAFGMAGVGTATITSQVSHPRSLNSTGTGSSTLTQQAAKIQSLSMTGLGTSALSSQTDRALAFSMTGTGASVLSSQTSWFRDFTPAGTGTSTLASQAAIPRAFAVTGTGTSAIARQIDRLRSLEMAGTGSATLARQADHFRAFSVSGVGSSTLATLAERLRAFVFSGTGTSTVTADTAGSHSASMTGTGASEFGTQSTLSRALTSTGAGTSSLGTQAARIRAFSLTGSGSLASSRQADLNRAFSMSGSGTSVFSRASNAFRSFTQSGVGTPVGEQDFGTTEEGTMTGTGTSSGSQVYSPGGPLVAALRKLIRTGFVWVNKWF